VKIQGLILLMPNQSLTHMEMMNSCSARLYECFAFKLELSQVLDNYFD